MGYSPWCRKELDTTEQVTLYASENFCGAARSLARLNDFSFTFHFHALEEEMATHSSVLAWRITWAEEPGRLQSTGAPRVGHD